MKKIQIFSLLNHICYIKDLNSYLYSNNKSKKENIIVKDV